MNRKETTEHLSQLLVSTLFGFRTYWASEVTFDYSSAHPIRVDFMQFEPVNQSISGIEHGIFKRLNLSIEQIFEWFQESIKRKVWQR